MTTRKLYDENAYLEKFTAKVISCESYEGKYAVVLNETAFFAEGGGQASDIGVLGNANVLDVQIKDGIITHFTDKSLDAGQGVTGQINFSRRFAFMQNHSGEHIVSGLARTLYGVNNVGFHLGEDVVTVDFDRVLSQEQLSLLEYKANLAVWQNLQIKAYYPQESELDTIDYRSKKEIDGMVRIVDIDGIDICACCAPHVKRTGEIGIIKLLGFERMRSGVRVFIKCGEFALKDYRVKQDNITRISNMLSSKQEDSAAAVELMEEKLNQQKQELTNQKRRFADYVVSSCSKEDKYLFLTDCDMKDLQLIADRIYKSFGGIRTVFSGNDGSYRFAMCGNEEELEVFFKEFKQKSQVLGGGRNGMKQGTVCETAEKIKLCF